MKNFFLIYSVNASNMNNSLTSSTSNITSNMNSNAINGANSTNSNFVKSFTKGLKTLFVLTVLPLFGLATSCSWQAPTSLSVKTTATYNWAIGSFERELSQDFSLETIQEAVSSDDDEENRFTVYDYNPSGSSKTQQYLIDFPIQELPVDFGDYLSRMDFAQQLEKMTMHQEVTVPDMGNAGKFEETFDFPDINEVLKTKSSFHSEDCFVPLGLDGDIPKTISGTNFRPEFEIEISAPDFETFEFSRGSLDIDFGEGEVVDATVLHNRSVEPKVAKAASRAILPEGYSTSIVIELWDGLGTRRISKTKTPVDLAAQTQPKVSLPLTTSPVTKKLLIKVSGSTRGGELTKFVHYTIHPKLSSDIVLKKATGLTITNDDLGSAATIRISNSASIAAPTGFVSCTIGDKSPTEISKVSLSTTPLPATWSGVEFVRNITLAGVLDAQEADFDKTGETGDANANIILGRFLPLRNKLMRSGDLRVEGTIAISLNNATLVFDGATIPPIKVTANTIVTKMNEVVIDMKVANPDYDSTVTYTKPLPDDVTQYISAVMMKPSGIHVKYVNTLPNARDNDIKIQLNSTFFDISGTDGAGTLSAGGINATAKEEFDIKGKQPDTETPITQGSTVDMSATMALPGATVEHPNYAVFKELEPNKKYTLDVEVAPSFDWDYIIVDADNIATSTQSDKPVDTGLNIAGMFDSLVERFPANEQGFINRINFQKIPLYLYAIVPDVTAEGSATSLAEDLSFEGKFVANVYNGSTPIGDDVYVLGDDTDAATLDPIKKLPKLVTDLTGETVTTDLSKGEVEPKDIAELFNSHLDGSVKIAYDFNLTSKSGASGLKIKKEALPDDDETTLSIMLHARIVLPMDLEIAQKDGAATDEERREPLKITLSSLIYDGEKDDDTDMLGRSEATDIDDFEKFLDAGKTLGAKYTLENNYFVYTNGNNAKMALKTSDPELFDNGSMTVPFSGNGTVSFSVREAKRIFQTYPFAPDLEVTLPMGTAYIPRKAYMKVVFTTFAKTDGEINLVDF